MICILGNISRFSMYTWGGINCIVSVCILRNISRIVMIHVLEVALIVSLG